MTGIMSVNGEAGGGPLRVGLPVVDMVTGLNAALGVLLALQERERSGRGQFVEAALYDCGPLAAAPARRQLVPGRPRRRSAPATRIPTSTPTTASPPAPSRSSWPWATTASSPILCRHLGAPALADDERFAGAAGRSVNRAALKAELEALLAAYDGPALADALVAAGVPCAPVLSVPAALQHPHTAHRGMVVEIEGGYRGIASPIKLSRTPATYRTAPLAEGERFLLRECAGND